MATKMGMKRTLPQIPLKRKTPLRAKKGLNKMSDKAKAELRVWLKIKAERIRKLLDKFGYIPCEYCHSIKKTDSIVTQSEILCAEAHHNNGNRRDNTERNCRIVHRLCNQLIEDENIKDVPSLL